MTDVKSPRLGSSFEVDRQDRIKAERYYDSGFFEMEKETGRSVVVVRVDDHAIALRIDGRTKTPVMVPARCPHCVGPAAHALNRALIGRFAVFGGK